MVLLVGVLWVIAGLQSGVLVQDGGKFSYPRALERLESLVATLNESLHETKEDLYEVRLCLNQTRKILGKVQEEKESLKSALVETRRELSAIKSLHQQAIDGDFIELKRDLRRLEDENLPRRVSEVIVKLDNLTSTVEEQGICIAGLKEDVEQIKISE